MLAGDQMCMIHAAWKPEMAVKVASYTFLILKDESETDF